MLIPVATGRLAGGRHGRGADEREGFPSGPHSPTDGETEAWRGESCAPGCTENQWLSGLECRCWCFKNLNKAGWQCGSVVE